MPKIKVEIEVPNVKYCKTCEYREYCKTCEYSRYGAGDFAGCTLFSGAITLREQDGLPDITRIFGTEAEAEKKLEELKNG